MYNSLQQIRFFKDYCNTSPMLSLCALLFYLQKVGSNSSPLEFRATITTFFQSQNAEITLHDFQVSLKELFQLLSWSLEKLSLNIPSQVLLSSPGAMVEETEATWKRHM